MNRKIKLNKIEPKCFCPSLRVRMGVTEQFQGVRANVEGLEVTALQCG